MSRGLRVTCCKYSTPSWQSIMRKVTWRRFDQSAKQLVVRQTTRKYDDLRLNMSHEGAARVWHVQPRVGIFPCRKNYRESYVLSSDLLQESWIICKLISFSPLYLHDLNTQDRRVTFGVSKTLCDFGHKKILLQKSKLINYRHHSNLL